MISQGDIRWLEEPHEKPRPVLVLASELELGPDDGLSVDSVATFDNVRSVARSHLTSLVGTLAPGRWHEVCVAVRAAIDC